MTVGTQAAVLAGLDITMFIEFNPHADADWVSFIWTLSHLLFHFNSIRFHLMPHASSYIHISPTHKKYTGSTFILPPSHIKIGPCVFFVSR